MGSVVDIDGSYGEGGGQVLRTALALSALTAQPTRIRNIRAGRKHPGLAPQHLTGVLATARISDAELDGAEIGSTEIVFTPGRAVSRERSFDFDVARAARGGSAGSVTLVLQTVLFPLAFVLPGTKLTLSGGTHVAWSPPVDYVTDVLLPTLLNLGLDAECRLDAWGFYPVGGGRVSVTIRGGFATADRSQGRYLAPVTLTERGRFEGVTGRAVVSNLPETIAKRMAARVQDVLGREGLDADISTLRVSGAGPGAGLFLTARYENAVAGVSALGKKGFPAEKVAEEACGELIAFDESGEPVDGYLADQLVLPMALARGRSKFRTNRITRHLLTNVHIIRQFIPAGIQIDGKENDAGLVIVDGIGKQAALGR